MDEPQIPLEEQTFIHRYVATGNLEAAARDTIAPIDASPALVKRTAMQALGDSAVRAYFIDLMEEVSLSPQDMMRALKDGLTTDKFGMTVRGDVVNLGPDGMTRMAAAKLIMQGMGVLGGGPKVNPSDEGQQPVTVNIVFPERNIQDARPPEREPIDGDDLYSVPHD